MRDTGPGVYLNPQSLKPAVCQILPLVWDEYYMKNVTDYDTTGVADGMVVTGG